MSRHRVVPVLMSAGVLALLVPGLAAAAASVSIGGGCTYESPTRLPYWTVSGAWDGDELLLVDAAANEIIRYGTEGRALGTLNGLDRRVLGRLQPSQIASAKGGMMLKLTGGRFVFLGADRSVRAQADLFEESRGDRGRIAAIRQWTLAGDELLLCGDVQDADGRWHIGYVRAPLNDPSQFEVLPAGEFAGPLDPGAAFCRLGYPQAASLGNTAYFVVMRETPEIFAVEAGSEAPRRLTGAKLPARPELPAFVTGSDFPAVFRAVERSSMVAGLLSSQDRLYALVREPRVTGTYWTLRELDPETGAEIGRAEIPSAANHLLVVPGERSWAFVEKGEVRGVGLQDVTGVVRVPAQNVRAMESTRDGVGLCASGLRAQTMAAAKH